MSAEIVWTEEKIRAAVATLKQVRPVYTEMLGFYEHLFVAQEQCRRSIHIDPISIPPDTLALKQKEFFPLINIDEFTVNVSGSRQLLPKICRIAGKANGPLEQAAGKILPALEASRIDVPSLFNALIAGEETLLDDVSRQLEISREILTFFTYNSIQPAVTTGADQLAAYLTGNTSWEKGYCPICGSPPALALFDAEGHRSLACSFCRHEWSVPRIFCPFCENRENKLLHYFYSEEEKEYRVDVCDKCGKYIKTIDTRKTERTIYPPLEQIATLHLDMKAKELGHVSGAPVVL
jgi:FdhE protein